MPRPKLSDAERKQRTKERHQRYYQSHKETILAKAKEQYDPAYQRQVYKENSDVIKARVRESYYRCQIAQNLKRLEDLKTIATDTYLPFVDFLLQKELHTKLYSNEVLLIESLILLAVEDEKSKLPVEPVKELEPVVEPVDELTTLLKATPSDIELDELAERLR